VVDEPKRTTGSTPSAKRDVLRNQRKLQRRVKAVCTLIGPALIHHFGYTWDTPDNLPDQFILLSNHEAYLDPALAFLTFPDHFFYFFMGEQVYRKKLLGKLAHWAAEPIPVMRQVNDPKAVRTALSILRAGGSIGLYPAGEREWDGHAMPIADSIGKFVKLAKVPLVTFNVEGLYFVSPRWSAHMRRLPSHGHVIGVYGAEQLAAATPAEITALVRRDLSFDSTAWRAALDLPTRGRDLAEWLETALYLCPACEGMNTLHSHGDTVSCDCGFSVRYTDRDVFEEGARLHTVHEWREWQRERLCERANAEPELTLALEDAKIYRVEPTVGQTIVDSGTFSLNGAEIRCGGWSRPFADIRGLAMVETDRILFTVSDGHFEIRHKRPWNTVGFGDLYYHLAKKTASGVTSVRQ